jgi:hypothetical protein
MKTADTSCRVFLKASSMFGLATALSPIGISESIPPQEDIMMQTFTYQASLLGRSW